MLRRSPSRWRGGVRPHRAPGDRLGVDRHRRPELVAAGPWFTWHEDLIDLPERAVEIARNDAGVQAFTAGAHLGVQFHPEVTRAVVHAWASTDGGARQLALAAKDPARLTVDGAPTPDAARIAAFGLLDAFLARVR